MISNRLELSTLPPKSPKHQKTVVSTSLDPPITTANPLPFRYPLAIITRHASPSTPETTRSPTMSFHQVLEKYRSIAFSEKDNGHRFERLMQGYLRTDPLYADQFSDVWQWGTPSASKPSKRLPPIQTNRLGLVA
jgi:hypothetical protein